MLVADFEIERTDGGRVEPVDVVVERPSLGAGGPHAVARASHRDVAVVRTSQDLIDRELARGEHARRMTVPR